MLMYEIANDAVNYIDYLINTLNLQISLCNIYQSFSACLHLLHPYNAHENSYCKCIKTNRNALSYCVAYQDKTMAKCQEGEFYGRCWAGVEEFVFPITANNKALGFISVSGYRDEHIDREQLGAIAQKYNLNPDILQAKFGALSTEKPNAAGKPFVSYAVAPVLAIEPTERQQRFRTHLPRNRQLSVRPLQPGHFANADRRTLRLFGIARATSL